MDRAAEARAVMAEWGCSAAAPMRETDNALLWPVWRDGRKYMLKLHGEDEAGAPAWLEALDGHRAVRVAARRGSALLLDWVEDASPSLADMALGGQDDAATAVLAEIALDLQAALRGAPLPDLVPLDVRMQALDPVEGALFDFARDLRRDLLADRTGWTALHGDLHHFNVMRDRQRGFIAIDPKGVLGPPVYDLANSLLNPFGARSLVLGPDRMARQAAIAAGALGVSPEEMLRWTCLHGCLAAAWDHPGGDWWAEGARIAGGLAGLAVPRVC